MLCMGSLIMFCPLMYKIRKKLRFRNQMTPNGVYSTPMGAWSMPSYHPLTTPHTSEDQKYNTALKHMGENVCLFVGSRAYVHSAAVFKLIYHFCQCIVPFFSCTIYFLKRNLDVIILWQVYSNISLSKFSRPLPVCIPAAAHLQVRFRDSRCCVCN